MALIKWFHELLNPHCPHCKEERETQREESHYCDSCETLKAQLAILNQERNLLLSKILIEPEPVIINEPQRVPTRPTGMPWKVRQQHLEAEDRARFAAQQRAAKPDTPKVVDVKTEDTEELEKELGIAEREREKQGA